MNDFNPGHGHPDDDLKWDRQTLIDRSRDFERNHPIVSGVISSNSTSIIGAGLSMQSRIDGQFLGLSDEQSEALETQIEREWRLFSQTVECDLSRTADFNSLQDMALAGSFVAGEAIGVLSFLQRGKNPYALKVQLVEPERLCNENNQADTSTLYEGVQKDANGAPTYYHIASDFPGRINGDRITWQKIPAFNESAGLRNVLHVFKQKRPGQTRGVPYLAPVVEPLYSLGRYSKAELDAAVVSSFFTVLLKSELPDSTLERWAEKTLYDANGNPRSNDTSGLHLGPGSIIGLDPLDKVDIVNPARPNANFDPFVSSILRQIGIALEIPFEVLIKHYSSSFSASYASMNDAWRFYKTRRIWFVRQFCQPIFEAFMYEAVARGRIQAPGFFQDPMIRAAYCTAEWVGPTKQHLNPVDEANAIKTRTEIGLTTMAYETAEYNGGQFEQNTRQIKKEIAAKKDAGLIVEPAKIEQKPTQEGQNVPD